MNQTCDVYHYLVQAVCKGFFKFTLASAIVQAQAVSPGLSFKLIVQTLGSFVMPGITQCVTSILVF
jgi:hypothetical protein